MRLLQRFKGSKSDFDMFACAVVIKYKYDNGVLYGTTTKDLEKGLGVCFRKARNIREMLIGNTELFEYNEKKDCLKAKSFKSKETEEKKVVNKKQMELF